MAVRTKTIAYGLGSTIEKQAAFPTVFMEASGVHNNESTAASNSTASDFNFTGASTNKLYMGADEKFCAFWVDVSTAPVGGTRTWEYWNGSAWTAMPTITYITGNVNLTADTAAYWDDTAQSGWAKTTVSGANRYWIRGVVGTAYSTAGVGAVITGAPYHNIVTGSEGGSVSITIPETVSRTFKSVTLRICFQTPIQTQHEVSRVRMKVGAGSMTSVLNENAIGVTANTESTSYVMEFDVTSLFTSSFTSTAHNVEVEFANLYRGVMADGNNWVHYSGQLFITYDFEDSAASNATQANTLYIPFESLTGALTTSHQTIGGTGGIPILTGASGFIKEVTSPTILDLSIVYVFNAQEEGTTNWQFIGQIDSEAETILANFNAANNSDFYMEMQWRRTALTTTSAHDIKARVSSITGAASIHVGGYIIVTYSYAASGITQRNMSLVIPAAHNPDLFHGTTSTDAGWSDHQFWIEDTSPTLQASGVMLLYHQGLDPGNWLVAIGGQTERSYVATPTNLAGASVAVQRFDSGSAAGAGFTLSRGLNTLTLKTYVSSTPTAGGGEYGLIFLNYYATVTAGKRTTYARHLWRPFSFTQVTRETISQSLPIVESSYFMSVMGYQTSLFGTTPIFVSVIEVAKDSGGFYVGRGGFIGSTDIAAGMRFSLENIVGAYKRYPTDPESGRVDVETARNYAIWISTARYCLSVHAVYHDYTYTISGQLANYSGDGSGITVNIYSKTLGKIGSVTTTAGGNYTFTWYDNTSSDVWAEARQSGTLLGRSDDGTAT